MSKLNIQIFILFISIQIFIKCQLEETKSIQESEVALVTLETESNTNLLDQVKEQTINLTEENTKPINDLETRTEIRVIQNPRKNNLPIKLCTDLTPLKNFFSKNRAVLRTDYSSFA